MVIDYSLLKSSYEYRQKFYLSSSWQKLREWIIVNEPLCRICKKNNILTPATSVDHIIDIKIAPHLCLDPSNCQSLCTPCHSKKTTEEQYSKKFTPEPYNAKEYKF
jgi:5-methylcytosine-specific restriction endonuclease McrA